MHTSAVPTAGTAGRPRSESARRAILEAVDDMLVEVGYAAMTMKGIAQRAGVGKQTLYRWWSSKAQVLLEATIEDAAGELATPPAADSATDLTEYVLALAGFLAESHAGRGYRALLGEAQHDRAVAELLAPADVLGPSARAVIDRAVARGDLPAGIDHDAAVAQLVGPVLFRALLDDPPLPRSAWRRHAERFLLGFA